MIEDSKANSDVKLKDFIATHRLYNSHDLEVKVSSNLDYYIMIPNDGYPHVTIFLKGLPYQEYADIPEFNEIVMNPNISLVECMYLLVQKKIYYDSRFIP
jgi:hypothetical protein